MEIILCRRKKGREREREILKVFPNKLDANGGKLR